MSLPLFPIWIVDMAGSALMILFSFLCVSLAARLREKDEDNVVWTYLLWLSYSMAAFAVSRSVGHIVKRVLLTFGHDTLWESLKPISGAMNTAAFIVVAAITLFFAASWKIYRNILRDRQALQEAHEKVLFMNRNLEGIVEERTEKLAVSERKYRRIFEVSRDMILVVSADGIILDVNPAGAEMLGKVGCDRSSPVGKAFKDFFRSEDNWNSLRERLKSDGYVSDADVQLERLDGSASYSVLLSGSAERTENGAVDSMHFLVKDISQRKAMERQLLQADKLASIGQLAAGIAHEVNNPLSVILGYTQLLLRNEREGTQQYEDHKIIEKHARTCKTIVSDLLSFARSAGAKKEIGHIHKALEDILSVLKHHFELDGVKIEMDLDARLPSMAMNEEKMKQVLMNLLMNAKQAIGKKGAIRLSTCYDPERSQAIVKIIDDGPGIDPEYLPRVFDPFFTTKGTGEGTGLGLSVSYGIVKDHGGEIMAESEPGKGAAFTIVLPVVVEEAVRG